MSKPEQIFLGNGEHSAAECYKLHRMLDEAFDTLSGIQQSPPWGRKEGDSTYEEGMAEVDVIARRIFTKLTGKKVTKTKEE